MKQLQAWNDPTNAEFEPTVFVGIDLDQLALPPLINKWVLDPYIRFARSIVRVQTDVVMVSKSRKSLSVTCGPCLVEVRPILTAW